jgi:lysophospholipase L1-like esterase
MEISKRTTLALSLLVATAVTIAACGGPDTAADPDAPPSVVVAALGDSITAGAPLWDPDPALRSQIPAPDRRSQYGYWAERALPRAEFRNCGVPGERTDEIAARLDACAEGADVLIVQGGVNDIAQGIAPAPAARTLRAMVRRGKQLELRVAIVELLPWNGGYPRADRPIRELNRRIALIGGEEDVPVLQWYDELEDPRQPGRMRLDLTVDLIHPSVKGYRRLGESVELP